MGSSKSPKPADTVGAAKAEGAANKEIAQYTGALNRPTQVDPYGQLTWSFTGQGGTSNPAHQAQLTSAQQELARLQSAPIPTGPRGEAQINRDFRAREIAAAQAKVAAAQKLVSGPGGTGTRANPNPGDWVQTLSLSPAQQAILEAEQQSDLRLQQLAQKGIGVAEGSLGSAFDPRLQNVTQVGGIGGSNIPLPSANYGGVNAPQFQGSQVGLGGVGMQALQGNMPQYREMTGNVPQLAGLQGNVPQYQGPQGNMPQFGANQIGIGANRLADMQRVAENPNQFGAQRDQVTQALYDQLTRFSGERFAKEEEANRTRLSNMGFTQGTAGYDQALREFQRGKDESYAGAGLQAILAGGQEQSRLQQDLLNARASNIGLGNAQFGQDQARYGMGLQEREAQFGAGMQGRQQQLAEAQTRFGAGLQSRQQQEAEALNRFQAGLAGRQQQFGENQGSFAAGLQGRQQRLTEEQTRQQAAAQQYGFGLDERQTAFQSGLARAGFDMNKIGAQFGADTNRYQIGLGERQAQQQSQLNQAAAQGQLRQQQFQEQAYQRGLPLNEVTALMSGSGVQMPSFAPFSQQQQWQGPQLLDAEIGRYNADLGSANAANAQRGQTLGALGTAAMAAAMFASSKDYKEDKRPFFGALEAVKAMPVEKWKYKDGISDGGTHIGPYAEDFHAATGQGNGKMIPIQDSIGLLMKAVQELSTKVDKKG